MPAQSKVSGSSTTSFGHTVRDATKKIKEPPDEQTVTFDLARAWVTVGGLQGGISYEVELERA